MEFNYLGQYFYEIWSDDKGSDGFPLFKNFVDNKIVGNTPMLSNQVFDGEVIQSFNVEEEEYCSPILNLTIRDALRVYSSIFKMGVKFRARWGYKNNVLYEKILNLFMKKENAIVDDKPYRGGKMGGNYTDGIQFYPCSFPQGQIQNGVHTFTVQMRGGFPNWYKQDFSILNRGKTGGSTLKDAILYEATNHGINRENIVVDFKDAETSYSSKMTITRDNKSFIEWSRALAFEYNLYLTYNFDGKARYFVLCDWDKFEKISNKLVNMRGSKGVYHILDIGSSEANVQELDYHINPSAFGSTAFPSMSADGKPSMTFTASPTEYINVWTLKDLSSVKDTLKGMGFGASEMESFVAQVQKMSSITDLYDDNGNIREPYKVFFEHKTFSTAPEMGNIEVNIKVLPDPKYRVGDKVFLGATKEEDVKLSQIPRNLISFMGTVKKPLLYRIAKVSWTHDANGVNQTLLLKR